MRIAFISDIHGNLEALNAVLDDIKQQRVKQIYCLGDLVGYCANPNEVVEKIKELNIPCVQGNHDFGVNDPKDFSKFNQHAQKAIEWTKKTLKEENRFFLANLPEKNTMTAFGLRFVLAHGSPEDPHWGYVFQQTMDATFQKWLSNADVIVLGATHIPFVKRYGRKLIINPGSVGQPRDKIADASYSILNTEIMQVDNRRVSYDIDTAAKKIITAGLPYYLGDRLHTGT